jgi:hypothetical protein
MDVLLNTSYGWTDFWIGEIMIRMDQFGVWWWFTSDVLDTLIGC